MMPRVVIVGLGPGDVELLTIGTREAINATTVQFVRTRRHPAAVVMEAATSFDDVYETAASIDEVYPEIVERLIAAATEAGQILYAVPGSPRTAALGSRPSAGDQGAFGMGASCTALPASDRQYVAASLRISASGLAPVRAKTA
jgi:precorrin-3B methylase